MASWIIALSALAFAWCYRELGPPGLDLTSFLHISESRIADPAETLFRAAWQVSVSSFAQEDSERAGNSVEGLGLMYNRPA